MVGSNLDYNKSPGSNLRAFLYLLEFAVCYADSRNSAAGGTMPTKNMSGKLGTSPSPVANRVISNNKNVQQPCGSVQSALAGKFTRKPVKVG